MILATDSALVTELKRLQVGFSVTPDPAVVFFPFRLRKLSLGLFHHFPHDFISSLFISSASTLVNLSIPVCEGTNHYPVVTQLYPIISARIQRLSVIYDDPSGRFGQLMRNCAHLRRLDWDGLWGQLAQFLSTIPQSLEKFSAIIRLDDGDALEILISCFDLVALSHVRRIKIKLEGIGWEEVVGNAGFEETCAERGVALVLVEVER